MDSLNGIQPGIGAYWLNPFFIAFIHQSNQFFTHWKIGKALAKVNGFVLSGQTAHHSKDSGAGIGEF